MKYLKIFGKKKVFGCLVGELFSNLQTKYYNILGGRKVFGYLVEKKALDI